MTATKKPSMEATNDGISKNILQKNNITVLYGIALIDNKNKVALVSSRTIAKGANVKHQAIIKSVKKHEKELLKHGSWSGFKIQSSGQKKEALFNEEQASLIMMLLRNTEQVVKFKSALVSAFYKLRRKHEILIDRHAKLEYQQNRAIGKFYRRNLTSEIKPFVEYAKSQDSKGSHFLYLNVTKWINKACGIESIEAADELQLANLSSGCDIALNAINLGMANNDDYKQIKASVKSRLEAYANLLPSLTGGVQ